MGKIIVALALLMPTFAIAANLQVQSQPVQKIVGGVEATEGEFPFIVSIHGGRGHFCGGSLIARNWVLTAAHCVRGQTINKVAIGVHRQTAPGSAEQFTVARSIVHPMYNSRAYDYDFALLQLNRDSAFQPITMNGDEIEIGAELINSITAGWGTVREGAFSLSDTLQKVDVPLVNKMTCNQSYNNKITDRMICAGYPQGGKDSCQGDSGGPLLLRDEVGSMLLVGVVSWGEGCARANKYGVYAKVNSVYPWIQEQLAQ